MRRKNIRIASIKNLGVLSKSVLLLLALFLSGLINGCSQISADPVISTVGDDGLAETKIEELLRSIKEEMVSQILSLNPGWNQSNLKVSFAEASNPLVEPVLFVEIGGREIRDLSFLKKYNLHFLKLDNTNISDLNFLNSLKQPADLCLFLEKNEHIEDYSALKSIPLSSIIIKKQLSFRDTEVINENTSEITLINTGVKKLAFVKAENLKALFLYDNSLLTDINQIRLMKNLKTLSFKNFNGDLDPLLENLPNLSFMFFIQCSIPRIPKSHTLSDLWMFECKNGIDFANLTGKTLGTLILEPVSDSELKSLHNVTVSNKIRIELREKLTPESLAGIKINGKLEIYAPSKDFLPANTVDYLKDRHIDFTSRFSDDEN